MMVMIALRGRGLGRKDGGVSLFIVIQSGICIFETLFWDPRVFFSRVSFLLDQKGPSGRGASVVQDLIYFIFFFSHDEVRWGEQGSSDHVCCFRDRTIRGWHGRPGEFSKSLGGRVDM